MHKAFQSFRHHAHPAWASMICAIALIVFGGGFLTKGVATAQTDSGASETVSVRQAALVQAGRDIFFDTRLSADGKVSCATCHQPDKYFTDGLPVAMGVWGKAGTRNTPSVLDVAEQRSLFWEGRRDELQAQATDPLFNPLEHGLASQEILLAKVNAQASYVKAAREWAGNAQAQADLAFVANALASFQKTLKSAPSAFDRYLAGQSNALSSAAQRGWALFNGSAQCVRCHSVNGTRPLFTDHQFHAINLGSSFQGSDLARLTLAVVQFSQDERLRDHRLLADKEIAELGRFVVTGNPKDIGKFKTPSLRNVAFTAPYMHNGSIPTLREAVQAEIYDRGSRNGQPLILTPSEMDDLLAFLSVI
jgi:cytochrome c peroxidase